MNGEQIAAPFGRLVAALEPWLDQVVIVGWWAHRLYRLHPAAQALDYPPLSTLDVDVALWSTAIAGETDIRTRLLNFGFTEEFSGEAHPPAAHYHLGGDYSGFYAEFLTPLIGGEYDRKRRRKTTIEVAGASAQQLRYIELLLHKPWFVDFEHNGFAARVRIANPVGFLAQKILIHRKREPLDRAKDIVYMRDTLEVFGARLAELAGLWRNETAGDLSSRQLKVVANASREMFGEVSDDIRRAAESSGERALDPEEIRLGCHIGFAELFAD